MAAQPQLTTEYLQELNNNTELTSSELVDRLSDLEAQANVLQLSPENIELLASYYGSYLFALFLDGDLNEARFLHQRFPEGLSNSGPILRSVEDLLRSLYTKQYSDIYRLLTHTQWTQTVAPLAQRFRERFSTKTYQLVSKTFVTITPESAAHYLGLEGSNEEVIESLVGKGWTWDAEAGVLKPKKPEASETEAATFRTSASSDVRLGELVELIAHLTQS
ncbi:hypothetical protein BJ508DRAFT_364122 [Ascobolus immersus RN42]|uniref:CSN8/PSMD8/EIF3K domain-containing protein n=1 Tax=Ascobolus immersus RN42 TaxID=1160509 RepID=A0A3N4HVR8_ASCIM|nr:hypothetical protein BJ508DRAFT_364122 [Ascobolus immersus RN42]